MRVNGNSKNEHQLDVDTHHGVDIDMCYMNVRSEAVNNNIQQCLPTKHQQSQPQLRYNNVCVTTCCSIKHGRQTGGGWGVATPPVFWKGGFNPPDFEIIFF